ncbi:hypothetical protein LCGC14_2004620, partial [marine sediment metagenome]
MVILCEYGGYYRPRLFTDEVFGIMGARPALVGQTSWDMALKTSDFDYRLPEELIAQEPISPRDESRLLVLDRSTGRCGHHLFKDLPRLLRAGDLMVLNDTRVIPARFELRRLTGGRIEGLFLREESPGRWEVMLKGAGRCKAGEELSVCGAPRTRATLA